MGIWTLARLVATTLLAILLALWRALEVRQMRALIAQQEGRLFSVGAERDGLRAALGEGREEGE